MASRRLNIAPVSGLVAQGFMLREYANRHDTMRLMKRVAVLILAAAAAAQAAAPQMTLKVGVDLVNVLFTVTDRKGHLVSGLGRQDFLVEEDGRKQDIQFFSHENELPLTLALLVDVSPSVKPTFDQERTAANEFFAEV